VDQQPVWSVSCLFVRNDRRRRGVSVAMLRGAVAFARRHGGQLVEGYPVVPSSATSPDLFLWTGAVTAFERAGFVEVARFSASRPIMRHQPDQAKQLRRRVRAAPEGRLNS
jgi:GNAT superfamily N-acetyltransferase